MFSSLPVQVLETQTIAELNWVGWQVELLNKRLKCLLDLDKLRACKDSVLPEDCLYGKLLYAAVIKKRMIEPVQLRGNGPR